MYSFMYEWIYLISYQIIYIYMILYVRIVSIYHKSDITRYHPSPQNQTAPGCSKLFIFSWLSLKVSSLGWGFPWSWGIKKGLVYNQWKMPWTLMIWGTPYFRKPPYLIIYISVTCIEYLGSLGIACHATMQQLQHRIGWDVSGITERITESKSRNLSRSKATNSEVVWDQKKIFDAARCMGSSVAVIAIP